uniref:Uncharacterized protein n=1 Tax=Lotus japonicus TaxID=34305 RepID=I3SXL7_LOTJA|nr:unknown [Lotus japonicus]
MASSITKVEPNPFGTFLGVSMIWTIVGLLLFLMSW